MLTSDDQVIAKELRQRIASTVIIVDFRVYGSRARGEADGESDFDVYMVVKSLSSEQRRQISEIAWEVGFTHDRIITTVVVTCEQLEHGPFGANPLLRSIKREGIVI